MQRFHLPLTCFLLLTGGCAFVDLNVAPPSASALARQPNVGRGREVILEPSFTDQRPFPDRCGMQKNAYNMDTANVNCSVPPPAWLSTAFAQGLVSAGFLVRRSNETPSASAVHIDGTVLQFFVEPDVGFTSFTPEADIAVKLVATSASGLRAERVFYVKGIEESLIGTEDNFQKATDSATTQMVSAMVNALAALMDRYPQLGAPNASNSPTVSLLSRPEDAQ